MEKLEKKKPYGGAEKELMLSVCILSYNHAAYIRECLEKVLSQKTEYRYEIVLHDDASTDGTQDIIREFHAKYPELIRPILRTENQYSRGIRNISGAFNFPRARGRYLTVLEGDDYWCDPCKLQKQLSYLEAHPETSLCFHAAHVTDGEGRAVRGVSMRPYRGSRVLSPEELIKRAGGAAYGSFMFRREVIEHIPDYYTACPVGDRPLELMCTEYGNAYYMDEPMSVYRYGHSGSWTSSMLKSGELRKRQDEYAAEMKRMYDAFDLATARRHHAAVEEAKGRLYFLTRVNLRDFPEILSAENRKFLRELSLRDRFFLYFEHFLPGLYGRIRSLRRKEE